MKTGLTGLLLYVFLPVAAFAQTSNATLGGTVGDSTGALIPGVTLTATNVLTGIVTQLLTNESGAYQFANLQPGTYTVSAELPAFRKQTYNNVQLGNAQEVRLNFTLLVASQAQTLDVAIVADTLLATSSASVDTVLSEQKIRDLPLAVRDVFGLVGYQAGVSCSIANSATDCGNFAGGRLGSTNVTRDGVNVNDGRYENGALAATYTSPDLVEEVRVIIAPVDAETSRGSGQVQMLTRSGTNQYRGSVFWNNLNSATASNSWFNNFNNVDKNYVNRNQYGGRIGGPIIKNRTFFFFLFDGQRYIERASFVGQTLTAQARQGLFRLFPGVDNGNITGNNPVVDRNGSPIKPAGGTGDLTTINLFESDPLRPRIDPSPFMREMLRRMPLPNDYTVGDGLNTAGVRFFRRNVGLDEANGNGINVDRDTYNIRIDHNFNSNHKLSLVGSKEHTWGNSTQAGQRTWPNGYDGLAVKRPDIYTASFVSRLSNSFENEFRSGRTRTLNWQWAAAERNDAIGAEARSFLPVVNGIPFQVNPGGIGANTWTAFVSTGGFGRWREALNPRHVVGDNVSWTHGKHAFKGGLEVRHSESNGFNDTDFTPRVTLGAGNYGVTGINGTTIPGLTANTQTAAQTLLLNLSGSVGIINQSFGVENAKDLTYYGTPAIPNNRHWWHQSESSTFIKDNWKVHPNLTLNLGVHWEWYGAPYEHSGRAAAPIVPAGKTMQDALCGILCTGQLTTVQFVGKNSTHPNVLSNRNDWNNFAPSIGFSWNIPHLGSRTTVLRAGYGINYLGAVRNFITVDGILGTVPGVNLGSSTAGIAYTPVNFTTLSTLQTNNYIPIPFATDLKLSTTALQPIPTTGDRSQSISAYDRVSPYTQNWNIELQREIIASTTIEVRYIGSKSTKLWDGIPLNTDDIFNNGLLAAFNITRAGGSALLFDQMLNGINLGAGATTVNGRTETGSTALRQNTTTRAMIANGNIGALANFLFTSSAGTNDVGGLLRRNGFPDTFTRPNAQFAAVTLQGNPGNSTYHSLQMQLNRRLSQGVSVTSTYTWSKALGANENDTFRVPQNRSLDRTLLTFDRRHVITGNGTLELPFGPNRAYLTNASSWLARIVEKWQLGGILNWSSGAPLTITAPISTIYNNVINMTPDLVGNFPKSSGRVTKLANGVYYFTGLSQITDPYVTNVCAACDTTTQTNVRTVFSNKAIVDANGKVILVNPQPGTVGTLGRAWIEGPRSFNLDVNLIKRVKISETKEFELRVDAINVLNHPNFGNPQLNINSPNNDFGRISTTAGTTAGSVGQAVGLGGVRQLIMNARVNF